MSIGDKTDRYAGKAKQAAGKATRNRQLEGEGQADQVKARANERVDDAKEKAGAAADKIKGVFNSARDDDRR
ncbi:CsbD family protein [Actinomadura macrotermitis]|uniref:CsbD-like domain-containing protein n=1 Tax=Actinomadura macrotermitis TaxID=2585200 RepID=A0A7K0C0W6_9ACTN|nr:hypothetical protein [Actinomadura macrotermitis]